MTLAFALPGGRQSELVLVPRQARGGRRVASGSGQGRAVRRRRSGSRSSSGATGAPAYRAAYLIVHDAAAAEDIAQEAFLAALRLARALRPAAPFGPWIHRIAVNRAIDWSRARALRREVGEPVLAEGAGSSTRSTTS